MESKWISVKDKLPNPISMMAGFDEKNTYLVARFEEGDPDGCFKGYELAHYWKSGWAGINGSTLSTVTHWMLLPDRPNNSTLDEDEKVVDHGMQLILESKEDAEEVLNSINERMEKYGLISVHDLYDIVGIVGVFADVKYGWKDLSSIEVIPVKEGYSIMLPEAILLD